MDSVIDGIYYTPKHIADIASGSGGFMKQAFDLTQNPPYSTRKEKTVKIQDDVMEVLGNACGHEEGQPPKADAEAENE